MSIEEFLSRMDAGEFDGHLAEALKTLTPDQLEGLAELLMVRSHDDVVPDGAEGQENAA